MQSKSGQLIRINTDRKKSRHLGCTCGDCKWFTSCLIWLYGLAGWGRPSSPFLSRSRRTVVIPWCSGSRSCQEENSLIVTLASTQLFLFICHQSGHGNPDSPVLCTMSRGCGERKAYMFWKFCLQWINTDSWWTSFCFIWDLWLFKCVMMRDNITRSCNEAIYIYSNSQHTHVSELLAALAAHSGCLKHKAWSLKCGHHHFS